MYHPNISHLDRLIRFFKMLYYVYKQEYNE